MKLAYWDCGLHSRLLLHWNSWHTSYENAWMMRKIVRTCIVVHTCPHTPFYYSSPCSSPHSCNTHTCVYHGWSYLPWYINEIRVRPKAALFKGGHIADQFMCNRWESAEECLANVTSYWTDVPTPVSCWIMMYLKNWFIISMGYGMDQKLFTCVLLFTNPLYFLLDLKLSL